MVETRLRPKYDADLMDHALVGITHRNKKPRTRQYNFVQKRSIDFTDTMWAIIVAHRSQSGCTDNFRETIYKALLLLKEQENLQITKNTIL